MRHRIVASDNEFAELESAWRSLLATQPRAALPLSWEWFAAWWHAFGGSTRNDLTPQLCIHVFETNEGLRAIVPMYIEHRRIRGIPVHALVTMANGHSPWWDALLHAELSPAELDEIGRAILSTPNIDLSLLLRIAADSPLLEWLCGPGRQFGRAGIKETIRTPMLDAVGCWEDHLRSRSRKYRRNSLRKIRKFEAKPGASVERIPLASGTDPVFDEIVAISHKSWKVQVRNDLDSNQAGQEFLRRLLDRLGPRGEAEAWLARVNDRAVAYELHIRGGGVTYPIRADFDESWRQLSPGSVVEYRALEALFADPAIEIYDSCADNYWYLNNLTDEARIAYDAEFYPRRLKAQALYLLEYGLMPPLRKIRSVSLKSMRRPSSGRTQGETLRRGDHT